MLKGLFYIFLGIMLACSCDSKSKKQNEQEANTPTNVNDSNAIAKIEFPQKSFNFGDLQKHGHQKPCHSQRGSQLRLHHPQV